jgi:membrane protein YqaA with SNARE-associated domain
MSWAKHPHAAYYLAGISFVESSVFPIPPDCMLIPMSLTHPEKAWRYALITMIASVCGGMLGYALGFYFFETIGLPIVQFFGYEQTYVTVVNWFQKYGFWAVLLAGFTPIPYKLFTIGAGVSQMAFLPFVLASIIGRGARFFLVAGIVSKVGKKYEPLLLKYMDRLGWLMVSLFGIGFIIYKLCP